MATMGTMKLTGESGAIYEFKMFRIGTGFKSVPGCYAFARKAYEYSLVYIGHTGDLSERFDDHHKEECIEDHGATMIGIHRTSSKAHAQRVEADLLRSYSPVCNDE